MWYTFFGIFDDPSLGDTSDVLLIDILLDDANTTDTLDSNQIKRNDMVWFQAITYYTRYDSEELL